MITIKKLNTLKNKTRLRKLSIIFHDASTLDNTYLKECTTLIKPTFDELKLKYDLAYLNKLISKLDYIELAAFILKVIDEEPSDWDYFDSNNKLNKNERTIFPITLILDKIRSPFNVGSIFRIADSFGVKKILLVEGSSSPTHPRAIKTSRGTITTVDWQILSEEAIIDLLKDQKNVMALELGGKELSKFKFPVSGFVIIGNEEFGISKNLLNLATDRISIELGGSKGSLNVSTATGIFLYSWFSSFKG